jgi:hypothetical protein
MTKPSRGRKTTKPSRGRGTSAAQKLIHSLPCPASQSTPCKLCHNPCSFVFPALQVLHGVADKHGVSISCVAARWVLQQPGVTAIVLGARNALHLRVSNQRTGAALRGC